jgi:RHS repeat-associated protein
VTAGYQADGQFVASNVLSSVHSPDGFRLQKTAATCAGGGKTNFVYDPAGHLLGEYDATGAVIQETVWVGDLPTLVFKAAGAGAAPFFVFADNLGAPRAIASGSGQVVWQWDGEPFGATPANSNPNGLGTFAYNLRFPGQYYDVETGYHHNGWREYDPALGRYTQSDPLGLQGGAMSTYSYVNANPLQLQDPLGLRIPGGIDLTPAQGAAIVQDAAGWIGTDYAPLSDTKYNGPRAAKGVAADCSGSAHAIYAESGYPYTYQAANGSFSGPAAASNGFPFRPLGPNEAPQAGDIVLYPGHMSIYDGNGGVDSAHKTGYPYDHFPKVTYFGPPQGYFRYQLPPKK